MDNFQKEFILGMFLDTDTVSTMDRLAVATANIVTENNENLCLYNETLKSEYRIFAWKAGTAAFDPKCPNVKDYYEQTVLNLSDENYLAMFKMKKSTVQELIHFLDSYIISGVISLDKKVHIFIWFLVSDCSHNDVGNLFGIHKTSVGHIFHEIAFHLCEHKAHFIRWSSLEEQHITRVRVNSRFKFPNCVGFIDACRFTVVSKMNKKMKPDLILLQGVCDENLMFMDIHIGKKGQKKKKVLFKDSRISQELNDFVDVENHLLGGSVYGLRKNLITPFTRDKLLTSEEMKFNEIHMQARCYISRAFVLLKERFKRLDSIDFGKPESIELIIAVSCILHNFIILHEGCPDMKEETITCEDAITLNSDFVTTAIEKRQFLCSYIKYIDSHSMLE